MAARTLNSAVSNGSPRGTWGNPVVHSPLTQPRRLWLGGRPHPTSLVGTGMDLQNNKQKTEMGGTKEKERKEEGKEWRGDEENRVEGAAAQPLASTARGGNRAEGHDPRSPAPTLYTGGADAPLAGPISLGAVQPIPGPPVAPVEPSTAAVSDLGSEERKLRPVSRPGPRSFKGKKGAEKGKELTGSGNRSRSNSRKRTGEDDGKESRERRRETGAGSRGFSRPRSGEYDTADEVGADELWPSDETISEASQPSMEPEGG